LLTPFFYQSGGKKFTKKTCTLRYRCVVNCPQKQCQKLSPPLLLTALPPLPDVLPTQQNTIMESQLSENYIESLLNQELNNTRTEEILPLLSANLAMHGINEEIGFSSQKIRDFQLLNSDGTPSDEFKNLDNVY
jgi:hypothetical protein